ncbi:hypothetical protein OSTOST_02279 [Ostertagia ostertagi]
MPYIAVLPEHFMTRKWATKLITLLIGIHRTVRYRRELEDFLTLTSSLHVQIPHDQSDVIPPHEMWTVLARTDGSGEKGKKLVENTKIRKMAKAIAIFIPLLGLGIVIAGVVVIVLTTGNSTNEDYSQDTNVMYFAFYRGDPDSPARMRIRRAFKKFKQLTQGRNDDLLVFYIPCNVTLEDPSDMNDINEFVKEKLAHQGKTMVVSHTMSAEYVSLYYNHSIHKVIGKDNRGSVAHRIAEFGHRAKRSEPPWMRRESTSTSEPSTYTTSTDSTTSIEPPWMRTESTSTSEPSTYTTSTDSTTSIEPPWMRTESTSTSEPSTYTTSTDSTTSIEPPWMRTESTSTSEPSTYTTSTDSTTSIEPPWMRTESTSTSEPSTYTTSTDSTTSIEPPWMRTESTSTSEPSTYTTSTDSTTSIEPPWMRTESTSTSEPSTYTTSTDSTTSIEPPWMRTESTSTSEPTTYTTSTDSTTLQPPYAT